MSARLAGYDLLEPITAEQPCGESLEDTALLASFDSFRLFGQASPPDLRPDPRDNEGKQLLPPPEWGEIKNRALDALRRSKDLRLLAHLGTASLWTDGLPPFAETLAIASQWLETYWAETYPLVDEDAILRQNALNCFADPTAVIDWLGRLPLVASRQHGTFALRELQLADADDRPDVTAAFAEMPVDDLKGREQGVADALAALKSIRAAMSTRGGVEAVPEFDSLSSILERMRRVLSAQLAKRAEADGAAVSASDSSAGAGAVGVGAIRSRQDAIRALDAVAEFFRRNEPSSPIPLFLERAKRLVSKNFLEVLADIAPEAVPQARAAGGLAQGE